MRRRHVTYRLLIALLMCSVIMFATLPAATAQSDEALLSDDFDDPAVGLLAQTSQQPDRWTFSYEEGEYVIRKIDPDAGVIRASLPGSPRSGAGGGGGACRDSHPSCRFGRSWRIARGAPSRPPAARRFRPARRPG